MGMVRFFFFFWVNRRTAPSWLSVVTAMSFPFPAATHTVHTACEHEGRSADSAHEDPGRRRARSCAGGRLLHWPTATEPLTGDTRSLP